MQHLIAEHIDEVTLPASPSYTIYKVDVANWTRER